jgi:hypothetical protein
MRTIFASVDLGGTNLRALLAEEVLGGGVAELGDLLIVPMRETIRRRVGMFPTHDHRIERSVLGDKAGLMGGIAPARRGGLMPT